MKAPYPQVPGGVWEQIQRRLKIACCHCGLCHIVDFQVRKGKLWWRVEIDASATRRHRACEKDYLCKPARRKGVDAKAKRVRS